MYKELIDCFKNVLHSIDEMEKELAELEREELLTIDFTISEIEKIDAAYEIIYKKYVELEKVKE